MIGIKWNSVFCFWGLEGFLYLIATQQNTLAMSTQATTKRRRMKPAKEKMSTAQLYAQIALVIVIIGGIAAFAYFVV